MKTVATEKSKKNGYQSDDDNIRYKINTHYLNNARKSPSKVKRNEKDSDDDNVLYKFPTVLSKPKPEIKPKPKIKVNFWSNKQTGSRLHNSQLDKPSRRHTVGATELVPATEAKLKPSNVKIRKRVSFLPMPVFSDNHVPMLTVPDDLTIQLNEEEVNDLHEDFNQAFVNSTNGNRLSDSHTRKSRSTLTQTSPKSSKRKRSLGDSESKAHGGEHELEFFTKYVVQKLRRMETNQRIYSENLINTVLMLGQLGKLNGKSKIGEA